MSIAELTSSSFPRRSRRSFKRRAKEARVQAYRTVRRNTKKVTRTFLNWQRSQYYLATATRDIRKGARANEDIFLGSLIVALIVSFAFASTVANILLQSYLTMSYLNDLTGISVVPLLGIFSGVLATLAAWLVAWLSNSLGLAVMEGVNRKRNKSLRGTLRRGLHLAARTTTTWFLLACLIVAPVMLAAVLTMVYIVSFSDRSPNELFFSLAVLACAGTLWVLYALTTFGLASQVALFETKTALVDTFARSRQLVLRRGRPFLMALYVGVAAFLTATYEASMALRNVFGTTSDVLFYASIPVAILSANLVLTALYRKRKLARSN
jgi:hypothetical protein